MMFRSTARSRSAWRHSMFEKTRCQYFWGEGNQPGPLRVTFKFITAIQQFNTEGNKHLCRFGVFFFSLQPKTELIFLYHTELCSVPFCIKYHLDAAGSSGTFSLQSPSLRKLHPPSYLRVFPMLLTFLFKMETHCFHLSPAFLTLHITDDLQKSNRHRCLCILFPI